MFQRPRLIIRNVQISDYTKSRQVSHDEDIIDFNINSTISGVNPYTGEFYGDINIKIIK